MSKVNKKQLPSNDGEVARLRRRGHELQRLLDVAEHKRTMMTCELHDGPVQKMAAALMHLDTATSRMEEVPEELQQTYTLLREAMLEIRRIMRGNTPVGLGGADLPSCIHQVVEEFRLAGLQVDVELALQHRHFPQAVETNICRILQECLYNVQRHSGSEVAAVKVRELDGRLELTVRDDGLGFDPRHVPRERMGLVGVQARAEMLGGMLRIESAPGSGTTVRVVVSLESQ